MLFRSGRNAWWLIDGKPVNNPTEEQIAAEMQRQRERALDDFAQVKASIRVIDGERVEHPTDEQINEEMARSFARAVAEDQQATNTSTTSTRKATR